MNYKKQSIIEIILLTMVTCGIYYWVWQYRVTNETNDYLDDREAAGGGIVVLLDILTCGIYNIYWWYNISKKQITMQKKAGVAITDNTVMYILLTIFSVGIASMCIFQSEVNKVWASDNYNNDSGLDF